MFRRKWLAAVSVVLVLASAVRGANISLQLHHIGGSIFVRQQPSPDPVYASLFPASSSGSQPPPSPSPKPSTSPSPSPSPSPAISSPSPSALPSPSKDADTYDVYYSVAAKSSKLSDSATDALLNASARATSTTTSAWKYVDSNVKKTSSGVATIIAHYQATFARNLASVQVSRLAWYVGNGTMVTALSAYSLPDGISSIALENTPKISSANRAKGSGARTGVIIGSLIGVFALGVLVYCVFVYIRRRRKARGNLDETLYNMAPPDFNDSDFGVHIAGTKPAAADKQPGNAAMTTISQQYRIEEWQEKSAIKLPMNSVAIVRSGGLAKDVESHPRYVDETGRTFPDNAGATTRIIRSHERKIDKSDIFADCGNPTERTTFHAGTGGAIARASELPNGGAAAVRSATMHPTATRFPRQQSSFSEYDESVRALSDVADSSGNLFADAFPESWNKRQVSNPNRASGSSNSGAQVPPDRDPSTNWFGRLHPGQSSVQIDIADHGRYRR